jgi:hypothetical protein
MEDIVALIDAADEPKKRGPYKGPAGVTQTLWSFTDMVRVIEDWGRGPLGEAG